MNEPLMNPAGEWVKMRGWIERRIESLRDQLENPPTGAVFEQTRGRIMELRSIVELVEISPPEDPTPGYFPTPQKPA